MKDKVYAIICNSPGIDTPQICLQINHKVIPDSGLTGWALARHLMANHKNVWEHICEVVDALLDEGAIVFTDGGKLYQVGYQGEVE